MKCSEWKEYKLSEVTELINRGITPAYTEDEQVGIVVLNQKCIRENRINFQPSRLTNPKKKKVSEGKILKKGDVLVNSTGVGTLGRVAQFNESDKLITVDSHITIVRPNRLIDSKFLGYNLFMNQRYIEHLGEGSTGQTELSRVRLGEAFKIMLPSLEKQKAIAKILSDLDEKIEINNKINKNLEEMAGAIFKRWFVDFEFPDSEGKPYKSNGGEMVESELGLIPKGWNVDKLGNYCDITKGLSYKGKYLSAEGVPLLNLGNVKPGGGYRKEKIKYYSGEEFKERHLVRKGDIIIANTDMTQDRVMLGSPFLVPDMNSENIIFTHHLYAFSKLKISKLYIYYYLKSSKFRERAESYATGTTVLAIAKNVVLDIEIFIPHKKLLSYFEWNIEGIIELIETNNSENERLEKLRDTLLPKLMSGEIRVPLENIER